jgi:cytoskeletal protein CcmA (bactofilin family)
LHNGANMRAFRHLTVLVISLCATLAGASDDTPRRDNTYLFGSTVRAPGPVTGDFCAAAGKVIIDQSISGDAVLAGGTITLSAPVGDDLRAASGSLTVSADIGGELVAAGGQITIGPNVRIKGPVRIAGRDVDLSGTVASAVHIYAQSVRLSGDFQGDVELAAENIEIAPNSTIAGNLRYASGAAPKLDPSVKIGGTVSIWHEFDRDKNDVPRPHLWLGGGLMMLLGLIALGVLLLTVSPGFTRAAGVTLRKAPGKSLLLGMGVLLAVPPLVILLMITVIGIPIALMVIAAYPMVLAAGYLVAVIGLGDHLLGKLKADKGERMGWRIGFVSLAVVLFALVAWVPVAGVLVILAALLLGIGASVLEAYRRHSRPPVVTGT